jgi:hypothetical protein
VGLGVVWGSLDLGAGHLILYVLFSRRYPIVLFEPAWTSVVRLRLIQYGMVSLE